MKSARYGPSRASVPCRRGGTTAALLCAALAATAAQAEAWRIEPAFTLSERYDDNPRLLPDSAAPDSTWATNAKAEIGLRRAGESEEVVGVARVDAIDYASDDPALANTANTVLFLDATAKGERVDWGMQAALRRDTLLRTARLDAALPDADPGDDVDEALVQRGIRRDRVALEPRVGVRVGERSELKLAARSYRVSYDDTGGTDLSAYQDDRLQADWLYRTSETDRLSARLRTSRYLADASDREYRSGALLAGLRRALSETTDIGFQLGGHRSEFDDGTGRTSTETGTLYQIHAAGKGDLTGYRLLLGRELVPSGIGDVVAADQLLLGLDTRLSERTRLRLDARFLRNEALRSGNPQADRRYLSVEPVLSWKLDRWWALETSYRYRRQKRDANPDVGDSHRVGIGLSYAKSSLLE